MPEVLFRAFVGTNALLASFVKAKNQDFFGQIISKITNDILINYNKSFYIDICYFLWEEAIIGYQEVHGGFCMKKIFVWMIVILIVTGLVGCENSAITKDEMWDDDSVNKKTTQSENMSSFISLTSKITELESGLSAVRFDGDYAFSLFLEQGGAESDQDVFRFISQLLLNANADLQMQAEGFGCSTISIQNTDGGYLFGRNFDWQNCDALIVAAYPKDGYASISTVNLGFIRQGAGLASSMLTDDILTIAALYAPLDGMNEKGLCVSVNMIEDNATIQQDTDKPDITTTTAIRMLLDKAESTDEALELLRQYDLHASMNFMVHFAIADNTGKSVAVEYINNEMIVTDTPILTNFYLAPGEKQGIGTSQSHERFDILNNAISDHASMSKTEVKNTLDSVSKDNFGEFESTEWSVVFDQSDYTATYYHRENYETAYALKIET